VVRGARVGPHLADTVAGLDGGDAEGEEHLALAAADSDGEGLQHRRSVLPCGVRVTAATHPLFAELLEPSAFKRWNGVLLLVVTLRDGSPGTIRADATASNLTRDARSRTGWLRRDVESSTGPRGRDLRRKSSRNWPRG
jgi:hypothetical protein